MSVHRILLLLAVLFSTVVAQSRPDSEPTSQAARLASLMDGLRDRDPLLRRSSATILREMGEKARPAITALLPLLSDSDDAVREDASRAVAEIGVGPSMEIVTAALPHLVRLLTDERYDTRTHAVSALCDIGRRASAAEAELLMMLDSKDPFVVASAAQVLHALDPDSSVVISKLTALLESDNEYLRAAGARGLERFGPRAKDALPALVRMLKIDRSGSSAEAPAAALVAIDRSGTVAIPAICDTVVYFGPSFLNSFSGWIRNYGEAARAHGAKLAKLAATTGDEAVIESMIEVRVAPNELIPVLETVFVKREVGSSEPPRIFVRADPAGELAIPVLLRLLRHSERVVRVGAARELAAFRGKGKPGVPALLEMFHTPTPTGDADEQRWERGTALAALTAIGGLDRTTLDGILARVKTLPGEVRTWPIAMLARLDPDNPAVVSFLAEQLSEQTTHEGDSARLHLAAAQALNFLGPKAATSVPALVRSLEAATNEEEYGSILPAIAAIGPAAVSATTAIERQFESAVGDRLHLARVALGSIPTPQTPEEVVRLGETLRESPKSFAAIIAANRLGVAGKMALPALPALVTALGAESWRLREAATWAIGRFGPDAAQAVPELIRLLKAEAGESPRESEPSLPEKATLLIEQIIATLGHIGPAADAAIPVISKLPKHLRAPYVVRRIDPPARKRLTIVIDPALAPVSELPGEESRRPIVEKEPDGSFRVMVGYREDYMGWSVALFLSKGADARPSATADIGLTAVEGGILTLKSGDWGSGKPIIGFVKLDTAPRTEGVAFQIPDPFAAAESRPK